MKKIVLLVAVISITLFSSCEGPQGIPGRNGYDGAPGQNGKDGLLSEVFETTISFNSGNSYSIVVSYPHTIYASDMVLVYRLDNIINDVDVWKLLPQTYYFDDGTHDFSYDSDFTKFDVNIYMKGNNLGSIAEKYRLNQTFRIVILPGAFSAKSAKSVNFSDYNAVLKAYKIDDSHVKQLN